MTNINDKIAKEIADEKARRELEKSKPPKVSNAQVKEARFVWMAGTILVDLLTAYLIYAQTGYWYYAVIWVLAGAGGLLYSERLKERIGNNREQKDIGERGVKTSAFSVLGMALIVGTVWVLKSANDYIDAVIEVASLVLFFFHLYQSYQYHAIDDDVIAVNDEARSEDDEARATRQAHRAARIVESKKVKSGVVENYRDEHGAAFDAAYRKDTNIMELDEEVFTSRQSRNPND